MEPETADRARRPAGLWLLTFVLLASPVFHAVALFNNTQWLNFGSDKPFQRAAGTQPELAGWQLQGRTRAGRSSPGSFVARPGDLQRKHPE